MNKFSTDLFSQLCMIICTVCVSSQLYAAFDIKSWQPSIDFSPLTHHWEKSADHRDAWLLGIELEKNQDIMGAGFFKNSYNQSSGIVFPFGHRYVYHNMSIKPFAGWRLGLIYSYRGEFEDKVPFSKNGWLPALLPSVGFEIYDSVRFECIFLINRAVMFNFSMPLRF